MCVNCGSSYDFDKDDYITPEDVKLILSHIPLNTLNAGLSKKEGAFTAEGGGTSVFTDRAQAQDEIFSLI